MGLKQRLVSLANGALSVTGARLVSAHNFEQLQVLYRHRDSYDEPVFRVGQRTLSYFAHRYNCGWPDLAWCSERSLELALADTWLELVPPETVTEIGAVTPYYW